MRRDISQGLTLVFQVRDVTIQPTIPGLALLKK